MTAATDPRSLNCPNCGAPLDFPPGQATIRCRFCDSTIERSVADLTDDDDAHIIHVDYSGLASPSSSAGPARRFVLKMRNGEPVVIEVEKPEPPRAPTPPNLDRARRVAAAAADDRRRAAGRAAGRAAAPEAQRTSPGCVLSVVAVAAVAVIIAAVAFANSLRGGLMVRQLLAGNFEQALATTQTFNATLVLLDSGVLVPGPADGPDQALLLSIHYAGSDRVSEYRLIAVDTAKRHLLWQSAPLGSDLYSTPILVDADRVYLVSGATLLALNRTDGTPAWSAPLADALSLNICTGCLQLTGSRLAALSEDGTLAVYDAATGALQWTATSYQASPRGLVVLGQRLAFMDRNEDTQGVLRTFDLATGREEAVVPECQSGDDRAEYADWTTALQLSPDGGSVYLAFGYVLACLQRWDAASLDLAWSTVLPEEFAYTFDRSRLVLTADQLYLVAGPQLLAVDVADGAVRPLLQTEDNELAIEAVYERDIVLRVTRTRGTTRFALWDVDTVTGATRWTFDLGDNPPVEPGGGIIDESTPEWLVQPSAAGLRLLRFRTAADDRSHALLTETLDWQTGQSAGQTVTVLNLPTIIFSGPAWTLWKQDTLWMVIENQLVAFDAVDNRVTTRWP